MRRLRPSELARQDQRLAEIRHEASCNPEGLFIAVAFAQVDATCCWCDCPVDGAHSRPGYVCDGCPEKARYIAHVMPPGTDAEEERYPLCAGHMKTYRSDTEKIYGVPSRDIQMSVLDEMQGYYES